MDDILDFKRAVGGLEARRLLALVFQSASFSSRFFCFLTCSPLARDATNSFLTFAAPIKTAWYGWGRVLCMLVTDGGM